MHKDIVTDVPADTGLKVTASNKKVKSKVY